MKKLFLLFALIGIFATACEEGDVNEPTNDKPIEKPDDGNNDTVKPVFEINGDGNYIVGAVGGTVAVKVTTNLEYDVVIDEDAQSWLSVADTRAVREETLIFTVAENELFDERSATVELKDADGKVLQSISFKQKGVEKVFDTDSDGNYIVEADGGIVAVKVTTNLEYDVIIPNEALAWISLAGTRAVREETLTLNVAKNEGSEERSTTVNLCAKGGDILQTITIKQNKPTTISCANNEIIYTTKYGYPIELNTTDGFGGNIMSHNYANGYGRISFDNDVVSIPNEAFNGCTTLTTIVLPNSLSTIDSSAFSDCSSLTSITIPNSVVSIGYRAFYNCSSLTSITIPDGVTSIDAWAFSSCSSLTSITIPDSVTSIGDYTFSSCSSLTSITIPDGVTSIGDYAFSGCSSLTEFKGKFASVDGRCLVVDEKLIFFAQCGLTEYTIPDSVTSIGNTAFSGCSSLTSITIPDSVVSIGEGAFWGCDSLTSVTIGNGVTSIGDYAFRGCSSLKEIYCKSTTPPTGGYEMFYNNASGRKIYVRIESVKAYKAASKWSAYADDIYGYNFENNSI